MTRDLSSGHLNRALLDRQLLLDRAPLSIEEALVRVGGLQAQYAPAGYVGLWTRLRDFDRDDLTRALEERRVLGQGVRGDRGAEQLVGGDGRAAHEGLWLWVLQYVSQCLLRQESVGEGKAIAVELISVTVEKPLVKDMPPGEYLTVRLGYSDRNKPVFVRPGKLKGTDQKFQLYERHLYYESLGRYTAQFGPLTEQDKAESVELALYSVTELKARAENSDRKVVISYPVNESLIRGISDKMLVRPAKE